MPKYRVDHVDRIGSAWKPQVTAGHCRTTGKRGERREKGWGKKGREGKGTAGGAWTWREKKGERKEAKSIGLHVECVDHV